MTSPFEFAAPRRVLFGAGRIGEAGALARAYGPRTLVFCGRHPERAAPLLASLEEQGITHEWIPVEGEPTFEEVTAQLAAARSFQPDSLVAMGGGSVIDSAKAVAMLLANGGDPMDYAEVIGAGRPVNRPSHPWVAVPTTAGAGAEATRNAVLKSSAHRVKVSLRSHLMLPDAVIIDPMLTHPLSPALTAATGMDALAQVIEPFVSVKANPVTDAWCRTGILRAARSLERACVVPGDAAARADMALAAWCGGVALANAGLGAVHGFAAVLGGLTDAPHGLICAVLLAPVCRVNIDVLRRQDAHHPVLDRYAELARILTGHAQATPEQGVEWLAALTRRLPLENLAPYCPSGLAESTILEGARNASSMKGNPVVLTDEQCLTVLRAGMAKS